MRDVLRAEARKAIAGPAIWWLLLVAAALVVLGTSLVVALGDTLGQALLTDDALREVVHGASGGSILMAAAGVIGMAGEWRTGQVSQTFLTTPRRERVLAAKTLVYAVIGLIYGVVASTACLATGWVTYQAEGLTFPLGRAAIWTAVLGVVIGAAVLGVLGVAVGALLRNQVGGIVMTLGWFFLVESLIAGASASVGHWLPGGAASILAGLPGDDQPSPLVAGAALTGVATVLVVLGALQIRRTDVTA